MKQKLKSTSFLKNKNLHKTNIMCFSRHTNINKLNKIKQLKIQILKASKQHTHTQHYKADHEESKRNINNVFLAFIILYQF